MLCQGKKVKLYRENIVSTLPFLQSSLVHLNALLLSVSAMDKYKSFHIYILAENTNRSQT